MLGEDPSSTEVHRPEPAGHIRETCAGDPGENEGKEHHRPTSWTADLVGSNTGETRTDDDVCVFQRR